MTINEFTNHNHITVTSEYTDRNPHMEGSAKMNNYKCKIRSGKRAMTLYFSKGLGLQGKPTVDEVLDCLASDASGYEGAGSFEDWCEEYGYDTDSRKAERTYQLIGKQATELKRILGEDAYTTLLWDTERL